MTAKVSLRELGHDMRACIEMSRVPSVGDLIHIGGLGGQSEALAVIGVVHFPTKPGKLDAEVHVKQFAMSDTLPWYVKEV